jgi:hypothetical protein
LRSSVTRSPTTTSRSGRCSAPPLGAAAGPGQIVVRNPAPDIHVRVRRFLRRAVSSDYLPVDAI